MPGDTWGRIGFGLGLVHVAALYTNGNIRRSPHVRAFCSGLGALFWLQGWLGMLATGIITTGWAFASRLVVKGIYNVSCAMPDDRRFEDSVKVGGAQGLLVEAASDLPSTIATTIVENGTGLLRLHQYFKKPKEPTPQKDVAEVGAALSNDRPLARR